jgi:hypothetical protein
VEKGEGQVANLATYSAMGMERGYATAVEQEAATPAPVQGCREEEYSCWLLSLTQAKVSIYTINNMERRAVPPSPLCGAK